MLLGASARRRSSHFGGHTELIPGLLSSWELADNLATTNVIDQLGNNHGTCTTNTNNLSSSGGLFGQNQFQLNGVDHVDISGIAPCMTWDKKYSVELWYDYNGSDFMRWGGAYTTGSGEGISIYGSLNRVYCRAQDSSGNYYLYRLADAQIIGRNHVILTFDGNGLPGGWDSGTKVYLNTVESVHQHIVSSGTVGSYISAQAWIGKLGPNLGDGKVTVNRFWEGRELSQANVTTLNNSGAGLQY